MSLEPRYQQDAYGFHQEMMIIEESIEECRYRLRKAQERKAQRRLAELRKQATELQASGEYAEVRILGEDNPATAFILVCQRDLV